MVSPQRIDVRAELDTAPVRGFHWLIAVLVLVASMFDGYDTVLPSYVIHYVAKPWHLPEALSGFMISAALIGFAIGSLLHGVIADKVGRRPTMVVGLVGAGVFNIATAAFADSFGSFVFWRVLTGLGLGVILPLGTAYLNEYLPAGWRNLLMAVGGSGFMAGAVLASVAGVLATPAAGWQVLFWIGGIAIPIGLIYLAVFPESAEYLVDRGRIGATRRLLARIQPERTEAYAAAELMTSARVERKGAAWLEVLSPRYRRTTIALWVTAFFVLFCIYGLQGWVPEVMIERGEGFTKGFAFGAIMQGAGLVGGIASAYLADRKIGQRRTVMLFGVIAAAAALLVAGFNVTFINIVGVGMLGFFVIGSQGILNNLAAMTYPVQIRASGEGFTLGIGRLGSILGPTIGGVLLGAFASTSVLFVAVAVAGVLAAVTVSTIRADHRTAVEPQINVAP